MGGSEERRATNDIQDSTDTVERSYASDAQEGTDTALQLNRRDALKLLAGGGVVTAATQYNTVTSSFPYITGRISTPCDPVAAELGDGTDTDASDDSWSIAVLPDTQYYAEYDDLVPYAAAQTGWIAENVDEQNITFATHEGDLVNDGSDPAQWERIDTAMEPLDGTVPYSTVPGNHDWARTGDKSSDITGYTARFGADRFDDHDWYGGAGPDELSHYQTFQAGGHEFLHLGLEWEPRDETLDWAQEVIDDHAGKPTIVTTHSYLTDYPLDRGRMDTVTDGSAESSNHGDELFDTLISPNEQIFMVLSGHIFNGWLPHDEGEYHQVSENDAGQPVYELLANYQGRKNGGNGWLRTITFTPGGGACDAAPDSIDVTTYSPAIDDYQTSRASDFGFELDFAERFARSSG